MASPKGLIVKNIHFNNYVTENDKHHMKNVNKKIYFCKYRGLIGIIWFDYVNIM